MKNPLLDLDFLRRLDLTKNKATYAKIILLTNTEEPVEEIQGRITSGSVNIDGNSAVRRTCSLSMVSETVDITNNYWALKNKFKLEVGVENTIESQYPSIIWFKQGIFVFTSLNMSVGANNFSISINGKDKMCLLNGEVSGSINAPIDFGQMDEYRDSYYEINNSKYEPNTYYIRTYNEATQKYEYTLSAKPVAEIGENDKFFAKELIKETIKIPIVDIVKNILHLHVGESLNNIVINDVDNYGLELLEYRSDTPLYMLRDVSSGEVTNMRFDGDAEYLTSTGNPIKLSEIPVYYNDANSVLDVNESPTQILVDSNTYNIIKIEDNMAVGYRKTDLTYPTELVANVGEALTSVLDKIKNMFSGFEYFYDIDGRFVFQKKKTYTNTSFNNIKVSDNEIYADAAAHTSATTYSFEDGILLSAFTDAPAILNIKNDFSVWGKRKSAATGNDLPIHMRYAIDFKPVYYHSIDPEKTKPYVSLEYGEYEQVFDVTKNNFANYIQTTKLYIKNLNGTYSIATKYIKDEQYYKALNTNTNVIRCDWRELIYQMACDYYKFNHKIPNFSQTIANTGENLQYYPTGVTGYETYYTDMQAFWRELYNPDALNEEYKNQAYVELDISSGISTGNFNTKTGFNENVTKNPEVLNFWFDFMGTNGELGKYAAKVIGNRAKSVNNDKVQAIYYPEVPPILFVSTEDEEALDKSKNDFNNMTGYTFIQLTPQLENCFTISSQGKSAKDELDNLLYEHTYANESVTLTAMPIYHLQPNTRIFVKDDNTGINGEFIVSKVTVPLQYNGTASINATRAVERIY